ncbi:ABC transporter permease [Paenibacillus sp. GCM10027626]|uniref:ABC transporter permease n=1 Tax=Paenibacillus sp. GCM10027626 TaxID=3273411 RepID=UPI00363109FA
MEKSVEAIWRDRAKAFWLQCFPYLRDMVMSGVPLVTAILFIVGVILYTTFIHNIPSGFPYALAGTLVMLPFVCRSPLRTWLEEADVVFLMPREGEMARYFKKSFIYNLVPGTIGAGAVFLVYSLVYVKGPGQLPWPFMLAAVIVLKWLNAAGGWRERKIVWTSTRNWMRLIRWIVTAVVLGSLMKLAPWQAVIITAAAAVLMSLIYSRLASYQLPWLYLIQEEARTKRRFNVFFSAFSDVPTVSAQVTARPYLTWIMRRLKFRHEHAFVYLYGHTLIRTELGGMLIRMIFLGLFSIWLAAEAGLWSGWGAAAVYLFFVWLTGLQIASLTQAHRYSVWRHVYPLPEQSRLAAVLRIDRFAILVSAAILWLPQLFYVAAQANKAAVFISAALAIVYIVFRRPAVIKRKFAIDYEDE